MIKKNNKERVVEEINENKLENVFNIIPNLSDKVLDYNEEKYTVTCGIFGFEKIMDDISNGATPAIAVSKFIHGIAYNAWNFAKRPEKIYLSGGFCENDCLVKSLESYCEVVKLGRFKLCEGLISGYEHRREPVHCGSC